MFRARSILRDPVTAREWADEADRRRPYRVPIRKSIAKLVHEAKATRVLELGAGPGQLAEAILDGVASLLSRDPQGAAFALVTPQADSAAIFPIGKIAAESAWGVTRANAAPCGSRDSSDATPSRIASASCPGPAPSSSTRVAFASCTSFAMDFRIGTRYGRLRSASSAHSRAVTGSRRIDRARNIIGGHGFSIVAWRSDTGFATATSGFHQ